jgi:hypothetical protein
VIRHIVFFKFNADVSPAEKEAFADRLRLLEERIPSVRELTVAFDVGGKPNAYELALDSVFDSMEDVEAYGAHPDHVAVLAEVKRLCSSTAKVDYPFTPAATGR